MKTKLATYQNDWYNPGANGVKRLLWFFINAFLFKSYLLPASGIKCSILRMFGATIGKGVVIKPNVNIKYPWFLKIADHVWIGEEVWIDNLTEVTIQSNVCLSQGAFLLTGNHNFKSVKFDLMVDQILLEEGVWIGAKAIVCPGVVAHSHAVLTVGSVATKSLDAYTIYAGNPAQKIKERIISQ